MAFQKNNNSQLIGAICCLLLLGSGACSSNSNIDNAIDAGNVTEDITPQKDSTISEDAHDNTSLGRLIISPSPITVSVTQTVHVRIRSYDLAGKEVENAAITWAVDDAQIATIDDAGLLTGHQMGQTTLTATSAGVSATVEVNVAAISRLEISPERAEIGVGETLQLRVKAYSPDGAEFEPRVPIDWQSSDPAIASIDASGQAEGIEPGDTIIEARLGELEASTDIRVELKFVDLTCWSNKCLTISRQGVLYLMHFETPDFVDNLRKPRFDKIESDPDTRFKNVMDDFGDDTTRCAISVDNRLYCWGIYDQKLGYLSDEAFSVDAPQPLETPLRFDSAVIGVFSICGLSEERNLYCWGDSYISGDLTGREGNIPEIFSKTPVKIADGPFTDLITNGRMICVQHAKDSHWACMGHGKEGQLGNGQRQNTTTLFSVETPGVFKSLAATPNHGSGGTICGVDLQDQVWCWGRSHRGEFGQPITPISSNIFDIPTRTAWNDYLVNLTQLGSSFCGETPDHEIRCWGNNVGCALGQYASGSGVEPDAIPRLQPPVEGVPSNWAKMSSRCVLTDSGDIWCWGLRRKTQSGPYPTTCDPVARRIHTY